MTAPVAVSIAATLPRNVQHSYPAFAPAPSSHEDTGTYKRLPCNAGAPVMRADSCESSLRVQRGAPVDASSAWTVAARSPKNTAYLGGAAPEIEPMLIAVRTPAGAVYDQ